MSEITDKKERKNPFFEPYNTPHDTVPLTASAWKTMGRRSWRAYAATMSR